MRNFSDYVFGTLALGLFVIGVWNNLWFLSILMGGILFTVLGSKWFFSRQSPEKIIALNQHNKKNALVRKYKQVDFEKYFQTFLRTGMLIAIISVLFAFSLEFEEYERPFSEPEEVDIGIVEMPPITYRSKEKKPEPLPKEKVEKKAPVELAKIKTVDDTEIVQESKNIEDLAVAIPNDLAKDILIDMSDWDEPEPITEVLPETPLVFAEKMPRFVACHEVNTKEEKEACAQKALLSFIYKNIVYPKRDKALGIEGPVYTNFVVEADGSVSNIKILREPSGGTLGDEVVRVLNKMPNWIPGEQAGKKVRVSYNIPVRFTLE